MDSNLRAQYPLSPRKFWKKIIEKSILFFILALAVTVPSLLLLQAAFQISYSLGAVIAIGVVLGVILFLVITGIYAIYVSYYIKTYHYSDDGDFLTIKKGVFAPTEIHVQYMKMQDVYVDQDILDRIMGLYDVHISSATYSSGMEAHIDGVEKAAAEGLKNLFLGKIKRSTHPSSISEDAGQIQTQASGSSDQSRTVHFSSPISNETYGLSSDWWVSEIVKLALGAVTTPILVSFWFYFAITEEAAMTSGGWRSVFYIWLAVFVLFVLYRSIYLFLWKHHYKYNFGDEYIYMKIGVLSISEKNMGYNTIQDVKVNQSFIDRIFGVADLVIENASPGMPMNIGNRKVPVGANGIVIEGLSLVDAKKIAEEMKKVILNKATNSKGL